MNTLHQKILTLLQDSQTRAGDTAWAKRRDSLVKELLRAPSPQPQVGHPAPVAHVIGHDIDESIIDCKLPVGTALYEHPAPVNVTEGYKLVPKEPTAEMIEAVSYLSPDVQQIYSDMLSAAPAAPAPPQDAQERIRALDAAGFELTARLCGIGIVAEKDGFELIRRDSVMEFVTKWRMERDAAQKEQK